MSMDLPSELLERLKFHCENNKLGLSVTATDDFVIILFGINEMPPNFIHLAAAQILITGVLRGDWTEINEETAREGTEEERKPS